MLKELEITCPKCQNELTVNYFDVINLNSLNKELLKKDELFSIKCDKCSSNIKLNYDCLCVDDINKYAIFLSYEDSNDKHLEQFFKEESQYQKRIVNSSYRLLEKIAIFDSNLDDHIIEIMKCIDIIKLLKEKGTDKKINIYFVLENSNKYFYVLVDDESYQLEFDKKIYDEIKNNTSFNHNYELEIIDYNWAIRQVSLMMNI